MKRSALAGRLQIWLFGLALLALAALLAHWVWLIYRDESRSLQARIQRMQRSAQAEAQRLGQRPNPPRLGPLRWHPELEVVRLPDSGQAHRQQGNALPLLPLHPHLGVRLRADQVEAIRSQQRRRTIMIAGEGTLAFVLMAVLVAMLLRMLAQERNRRRETEAFISSVSHELKTPLAGIRALLGTLQLGHVPPVRLQEFLDMGLRETDRLEHLVENLLLANRIRSRLIQVALEPVALEPFLRAFAEHRAPLVPDGHPGVQVDAEAARDLWVQADPDKLHVVLDNLTDNAIKYGEGSPVRIGVRVTDARVAVDVEDAGVGFAPEEAEHIFNGRRTSPTAGGALVHGTGLGLGIARDLARAMGGRLTAFSDGPGKGSRFSVHLQRSSPGAPTETQPTETQPTEAQPTEAQPTEAQPTEAQPTEAQPTEAQPTEAQLTKAQPEM